MGLKVCPEGHKQFDALAEQYHVQQCHANVTCADRPPQCYHENNQYDSNCRHDHVQRQGQPTLYSVQEIEWSLRIVKQLKILVLQRSLPTESSQSHQAVEAVAEMRV